jgi:hypothetical protein
VQSGSDDRAENTAARIVLRPIASPLTLAFLALAVGTFTVAGIELSWIPAAQDRFAGLAVLAFVFPLQAIACIYGFLARDSIAGTGMGLLAGGWLVIGMLTFLDHQGGPLARWAWSCSRWPPRCWSRPSPEPGASRWPAWSWPGPRCGSS